MRPRFLFVLLALLAAVPLSAQFAIDDSVILQTGEGFGWAAYPGYPVSSNQFAFGAVDFDPVPVLGKGRLLSPLPWLLVYHDQHTVVSWKVLSDSANRGYVEILKDDADLADIAPLRSGHFLVAETPNARGAKLIEFDLQHKIAEIPFDGADHIDVLSDGCTLLYTNHDVRIRRMNLCTQQQEADYATLLPGESAGALRQMPNGDVIVAAGNAVVQLRDGRLWSYYPFDGVTQVALSADGTFFWAAGVQSHRPVLRQYDPSTATFMNVFLQSSGPAPTDAITDLTVVGEWRAGNVPPRSRAVRRR